MNYDNIKEFCRNIASTTICYDTRLYDWRNDYNELITFNTFKYGNIIELPLFHCCQISSKLRDIGSFPVRILLPPEQPDILITRMSRVLKYFTNNDFLNKVKIKEEESHIEGPGIILDYKYNPYVIMTADVKLLPEVPFFMKFHIKVDTSVMEKSTTIQRIIYNRIIKPFYEESPLILGIIPIELTFCNLSSYITNCRADSECFGDSLNISMFDKFNHPTVIESMCDLL